MCESIPFELVLHFEDGNDEPVVDIRAVAPLPQLCVSGATPVTGGATSTPYHEDPPRFGTPPLAPLRGKDIREEPVIARPLPIRPSRGHNVTSRKPSSCSYRPPVPPKSPRHSPEKKISTVRFQELLASSLPVDTTERATLGRLVDLLPSTTPRGSFTTSFDEYRERRQQSTHPLPRSHIDATDSSNCPLPLHSVVPCVSARPALRRKPVPLFLETNVGHRTEQSAQAFNSWQRRAGLSTQAQNFDEPRSEVLRRPRVSGPRPLRARTEDRDASEPRRSTNPMPRPSRSIPVGPSSMPPERAPAPDVVQRANDTRDELEALFQSLQADITQHQRQNQQKEEIAQPPRGTSASWQPRPRSQTPPPCTPTRETPATPRAAPPPLCTPSHTRTPVSEAILQRLHSPRRLYGSGSGRFDSSRGRRFVPSGRSFDMYHNSPCPSGKPPTVIASDCTPAKPGRPVSSGIAQRLDSLSTAASYSPQTPTSGLPSTPVTAVANILTRESRVKRQEMTSQGRLIQEECRLLRHMRA